VNKNWQNHKKKNEQSEEKMTEMENKYETLNKKYQEKLQQWNQQQIDGIKTILANELKEEIVQYFEVNDVIQEKNDNWTNLSITQLLRKCEELKNEEKLETEEIPIPLQNQHQNQHQNQNQNQNQKNKNKKNNNNPNSFIPTTAALLVGGVIGIAIGIYGQKHKWWDGWF